MPDPNPANRVFIPLTERHGTGSFDILPGSEGTPSPTPIPTRTPAATSTPSSIAAPTSSSAAAASPTATRAPTSTAAPRSSSAPAIYIDLKRCIGCNACSLACKQENNVELGELWNRVYGSEQGTLPQVAVRVLPMLCHHCGNAPCKAKCDSLGFRALVQRSDGIVYIDAARCTGCQKCLPTCPYKALSFNAKTNKAEKCHLCMHRLDAGLPPACVITCLAITREFGNYDTLRAKHPNAKAMGDKVRILYDNLGGEPNHDGATGGYPSPVECHH